MKIPPSFVIGDIGQSGDGQGVKGQSVSVLLSEIWLKVFLPLYV